MKEIVDKRRATVRLGGIAFVVGAGVVATYFILRRTGVVSTLGNLSELKRAIVGAGALSYALFALLQFLQVTLIPLPSSVTTLCGILLFGAFKTFVISLCAILLGSVVAYMAGRMLGKKVLPWAVGSKKAEELQALLGKGRVAFFLMMLFPFFPDDILCLMAGVSRMDFKFFLITNIITRSVGLAFFCFLCNSLSLG